MAAQDGLFDEDMCWDWHSSSPTESSLEPKLTVHYPAQAAENIDKTSASAEKSKISDAIAGKCSRFFAPAAHQLAGKTPRIADDTTVPLNRLPPSVAPVRQGTPSPSQGEGTWSETSHRPHGKRLLECVYEKTIKLMLLLGPLFLRDG